MNPRAKTVNACSEADLIIDAMADVITRDIVKDPEIKWTADDAIQIRDRLSKMDKISEMWFAQLAVREEVDKGYEDTAEPITTEVENDLDD